jgi:hypothetical protein
MRILILVATLAAIGSALPAQRGHRPNSRDGFWFGVGLGTGSAGLDCTSCPTDRVNSVSGYFRAGGTVSRHLLLGGESNGWTHSVNGLDESIGFVSFVALYYPKATGAFYVKLGVGGMTYRSDDGTDVLTATAPSGSIGIGYEARIGQNVSIVPFANALGSSPVTLKVNGEPLVTNEDLRLNLLQLGLGLTWH